MRLSERYRNWVNFNESRGREFVIYMGKLTHEANHCLIGEKLARDSDPLLSKQRRKLIASRASAQKNSLKKGSKPADSDKKSSSGKWLMPRGSPFGLGWQNSRLAREQNPSAQLRLARAQAAIKERNENAFIDWWRESRAIQQQARIGRFPRYSHVWPPLLLLGGLVGEVVRLLASSFVDRLWSAIMKRRRCRNMLCLEVRW